VKVNQYNAAQKRVHHSFEPALSRTAYSRSRAHVDFDCGFFGELVAAGDFDRAIDGGEDGEEGVCVGC
jgi:hypothetical protein